MRSRSRTPFAAFGALLFLLHPLQTEAVAYIAGRSESLSGMFVFAAFAVFLYRRATAISWAGVAAVVLLCSAPPCSPRNRPSCCPRCSCSPTLVESRVPVARRPRQLEALRRAGAGRAGRRGVLLEADPRHRHRTAPASA